MKKQILFLFVVLLFIIPMVSAEVISTDLSWNPFGYKKIVMAPLTTEELIPTDFMKEVVDYKEAYPSIRISNTIFWIETDQVAEYKITDNTDNCDYNCETRGRAVLYKDGTLFEDAKFIDTKTKEEIEINGFQYYIKTGIEEYEEELNEWGEVCKNELNGSKTCNYEIIKTSIVTKERDIWEVYNGSSLKAGEYEWKITGSKGLRQSVDFIPTALGWEFEEWIVWNYITERLGYYNGSWTGGSGGNTKGGFNVTMWKNASIFNVTIEASATCQNIIILDDIDNSTVQQSNGWSGTTATFVTPVNLTQGKAYHIRCQGVSGAYRYTDGGWTGTALNYSEFFVTGSFDNDASYTGSNFGVANIRDWFIYSWAIGGAEPSPPSSPIGLKVNLVSPANASTTENLTTLFIANATSTNSNLTNATFYLYRATTLINKNYTAIAGSPDFKEMNFSYGDLSSANYTWNVEFCSDNSTGSSFCNFSLVNRTLEVITAWGNVTLNSPPDNYQNFTNNTIFFNVSAISYFGRDLVNGYFILNGIINQTISLGSVTTYEYYQKKDFADGYYNWSFVIKDDHGEPTETINRSFFIELNAPSITITSPIARLPYGKPGLNVSLNYTIIDPTIDSCWLNYNNTNTTIPCSLNSSIILTKQKNLTIYANDSAGNLATRYYEWNYTMFENSQTFNPTTYRTYSETFSINVTLDPIYYPLTTYATLYYNNTAYTGTINTIDGNKIINATITIPNIAANSTNITFYWAIGSTNSTGTTYVNSTGNNQTVYLTSAALFNATCSAGLNESFIFRFAYETNLSLKPSSGSYVFYYGYGGNPYAIVLNGTFNELSNLSFCTNWSQPAYSLGYGEIQYTMPGAVVRRYYLFNNTRVTNQTIDTTLYGLDTTLSTPFQITATSTTLSPYINHYISLLRWYPSLNEYKIVEMGKTDDQGQTVIGVKINEVDYRLGLYENDGTLIKLLNPLRMVCQTSPCIYSIITSGEEVDLTNFLNVQQSLTFNSTTKKYTFVWNDPSQNTDTMNLTVWKETGINRTIICSNTASGFTGILICDISAHSGSFRAEAWRKASPQNIIAKRYDEIRNSFGDLANGKDMGLFLGILLVVAFSLMGAISPIMVVIMTIVALVPMVILGNISLSIFMIIGSLGGLILWFLRRTGGN